MEITIYNAQDRIITVTGTIIKGQPGLKDHYGVPETPDDDDYCEISHAYDEEGNDVELTANQKIEATEAMFSSYYQ